MKRARKFSPDDPYGPIAGIYDLLVGDRAEPRVLRRLVRRFHPHARRLLEIGCGTGAILYSFARDFELSGVDVSSTMLAQAKARLPDAAFYAADMRTFDLQQRFDVIISAFNSMNHLLQFRDWHKVFRQVKKHLAPDGIFIFDVSTRRSIDLCCADSPIVKEFADRVLLSRFSTRANGGVDISVKVFERHNRTKAWALAETVIRERVYSLDQIKRAMGGYFSAIHMFDPHRPAPSSDSEIVYFVGR